MPGIARVVAGACGSPGSLVALQYADFLARAHDAILVPVMAWEPPGGDRAPQVQAAGGLVQVWHEMAVRRHRAALAAFWGEVPSDLRVRPQLKRGPAGWVLVNVACLPDDVPVVGAGRRGALRRAVGRAISRYRAAMATCPVVLVPPPELALEMSRTAIALRLLRPDLTPAQLGDFRRKPAAG
jgi:nucleotide-binding universal stress UspA family protein